MSFVSGTTGNEAAQKFLEVLQADFKNLGQETKKKYPQIKEVSLSKIKHNTICIYGSCVILHIQYWNFFSSQCYAEYLLFIVVYCRQISRTYTSLSDYI